MFLEKIIQRNHKLLECGFDMHSKGLILPDTYVLDLDTIKENARMILEKANEYNIDKNAHYFACMRPIQTFFGFISFTFWKYINSVTF